MSEQLLLPQAEPLLEKLKSVWPWGKKVLVDQLNQYILATDEQSIKLQALYKAMQTDLDKAQSAFGLLDRAHVELNVSYQDLQVACELLSAEHDSLKGSFAQVEDQMKLIESRYNLVRNILNSKPVENVSLRELKSWLAKDFAHDVQRLELPADDTSPALEQAQAISLHAELLSDSPALRSKFLVAVAGGFSSGKSSFVTSFMHKAYWQLLAKGIQPVTAIPTYVIPGAHLSIYGHTKKGAHVELSQDEYAQLTHDFIANMGFNVKDIMPHVVIEASMPNLEHLAFIDMPGYDPAASETADTEADYSVASAALGEADAVIWLIALDSNGTLPANDLEFLLEHADDRPLYVVLNKADLRPLSSIEAVVQEISEHLDDSGIHYEGVCAYSSTLGQELFHYRKSLKEVMEEWDHYSDAALALHREFDSLISTLEKNSGVQLNKVEAVQDLVHSLELDMMQMVGSDSKAYTTAKRRLGELRVLTESISGTERADTAQRLERMRAHGHQLLRNNFSCQ